ncbi:MAG: translation initiation factor IF-1 [Opitutales bacterium]|nr:translation initiation factor IF-1 [Verrucomicrobiota bacterium]MBQ2731607.1 translation initiation factor IF-1 [Opitutales bacterium]MBR6797848.1 translation initiation factor IF-1 [Opitutales bacterium]
MADGLIELEGKIIAVLPGTMFRIELPNKHVVLGHISGKLRKNFIKIFVGDTVRVEMDPKDLTQARITYRLRNATPAMQQMQAQMHSASARRR